MFATVMGFSDKRPANYPAIDRAALMRDAHQIAGDLPRAFCNLSRSPGLRPPRRMAVGEIPTANPIARDAGGAPGNSAHRSADRGEPRRHAPLQRVTVGELSMSDPRLAAANRIIAAQNRALAKAHAALKEISRNTGITDERLGVVDAAIAEIEGRATTSDASLDRTLAIVLHVMADG